MTSRPSYALVTPAKDEAKSLERLAACVVGQSLPPVAWVIVDNGSSDETADVAADLAARHAWISVLNVPGDATAPGAPVVRSFNAGLATLDSRAEVIVKLDADVSFDPDYFERMANAFAEDPRLGIASGVCYELENDRWEPRHVTGDHVRGATRAYRRACLAGIGPLPESVGWDGVDELKAAVLGWRTGVVRGLPFYHHRKVGERDGGRARRWLAEGQCAHYMGYSVPYLIARTAGRIVRDRDAAALAMLWGFVAAKVRRVPPYGDPAVREYLRRQQRLRDLPLRMRESFGRRPA
jgi:glycosyltransferase involved in cell wall biosynthesis